MARNSAVTALDNGLFASPFHLESRSLNSGGDDVRVIFVNRLKLARLPFALPEPSILPLPGMMGIPSLMYLIMIKLNTELLSYMYNIAAGIRAATIHRGQS